MKHLKRFESFEKINEDFKPGSNIKGSKKISIKEEDVNLFSSEPILQKLISDDKISIIDNNIYYNDESIIDILDQYFEI